MGWLILAYMSWAYIRALSFLSDYGGYVDNGVEVWWHANQPRTLMLSGTLILLISAPLIDIAAALVRLSDADFLEQRGPQK
jgi:hypothetical protein